VYTFGLFDHEHHRVSHLEDDEIPIHIQDYLYKRTKGTYHVVQSKSKGGFRLYKRQDRSTVFGTIDESTAVAVSLSGQTRYTFLVEPSIPNPDEFINLIIIDDEVTTLEYFIKYEFDSDRQVRTAFDDVDMSQFTGKISYFDGDGTPTGEFTLENGETTNSNGSGTPCPPDDSDDPNDPNDPTNDDNDSGAGNGGCTVNCGGDGHDDNTNEPGGGDGGGNGSEICSVEISYDACCNGNVEPHGEEECGCGPGNLDTMTITISCQEGSRTADLEPFECDDNDVGVLFRVRKECKKIKNTLNNNASFREVMLEQVTKLNDSIEWSAIKFKDIDNIHISSGTSSNQAAARVLDEVQAPANYVLFFHTHYEDPNTLQQDTFSVFSMQDLFMMARLAKHNKLEDDFVALLATGKGTYYALTIPNAQKLIDFYEPLFGGLPITSSPSEIIAYNDARSKLNNLSQKFYDKNTGIIKESNTNNGFILGAFLDFLDQADMGVSLFKTDSTFTNFTNVSLGSSSSGQTYNVKEKPCDN